MNITLPLPKSLPHLTYETESSLWGTRICRFLIIQRRMLHSLRLHHHLVRLPSFIIAS